ncbi:hypothetical protein [Spirillospora sp. CA-128828]|uniref:hypothetical protein n=1 Tax=Spirillospora sp. CA-128828 TaxID=3240033 RepID=UPI003D9238EE
MAIEARGSDENDHDQRTKTFTRAAAVASAAWQMGIALGHAAVQQQSEYFKIRAHVEQLLCETNRWVRGDLTDYQRLFIDNYLHHERPGLRPASAPTGLAVGPSSPLGEQHAAGTGSSHPTGDPGWTRSRRRAEERRDDDTPHTRRYPNALRGAGRPFLHATADAVCPA